ncbi:Esterase/lipase/thioesterase [Orbilia blumenaviensis]|uniref:lytic cellulose monooxygenase (C4-dehydrogenating) n=1 Tax=Orbilia blumenaviensis TaxID=1796055 RepID=A0AAV9VIS7_9PEZI
MWVKQLFAVTIAATTVAAHGYVRDWTIGGKTYVTLLPAGSPNFTAPVEGIGRALLNGDYPMTEPLSNAMACNVGAYPAPKYANVTAGTNVTARWTSWPHVGPIYTYMAYCPNGKDCSDFYGWEKAAWFKIEETAFVPYVFDWNPSGVAWATQKMYDDGMKWTFQIPKCIKNGPYLIRHETMAIHNSQVLGGAQFYPNCAQVWVSGGTGKLKPKLVKLPGDIQPTDPGVLFERKDLPFDYTVP